MSELDYEAITQRIDRRCTALCVTSVDGLSDERLAEIRADARGISTLEATHLHHALSCSISYLIFGRE